VLNKCRLTDTEVSLIGSALIKHRSSRLRKLYLNENDLGNAAALKLAEVLADPGLELKELGLKWNRITAIGGNAIAAALDTNVELKILDLSWNSIGVRPPENKKMRGSNIGPGEVGIAWGTALSNN
jgi:Ran GTPase-activating protein (RanGAP) involved in mRNA processing and transport